MKWPKLCTSDQITYSAGWAARKGFMPRDPGPFRDALSSALWLRGYDECEQHWRHRCNCRQGRDPCTCQPSN